MEPEVVDAFSSEFAEVVSSTEFAEVVSSTDGAVVVVSSVGSGVAAKGVLLAEGTGNICVNKRRNNI